MDVNSKPDSTPFKNPKDSEFLIGTEVTVVLLIAPTLLLMIVFRDSLMFNFYQIITTSDPAKTAVAIPPNGKLPTTLMTFITTILKVIIPMINGDRLMYLAIDDSATFTIDF